MTVTIDDGAGDPVDHVRVLGDEHVVGGPLDEEGDGAGGRRGEQHGERSDHQQPEARAQMLPPDAPDDVAGRVMDLELVGAPGDRARVSEELVFQAFPRFLRPRRSRIARVPFLARGKRRPLRRKSPFEPGRLAPPASLVSPGRAAGADAR